ncbi:coiled-coil domain-containing protein 170 isoform X1 [Alligator mississippiensis]|uniref:coiled-coil domain-containing protein 170 isoform X1 n=1 Tax=Alligator mississippiensis TaxID=8496 RepID=UPI00071148E2|nr:coiled-coil domain-containing protein 170 isoform X1 [Alligator mississippiensis]
MSRASSSSSGSGGSWRAGSAAASRLIDVTSNAGLLPYAAAAAPLEPEVQVQFTGTDRQIEDGENVSVTCNVTRNKGRTELQKGAYDHLLLDIPVTREQISRYRAAAETTRSKLAALLVKYECTQSELLELRSKMASKEASFQELKAEVESYKENNARQSSLLTSLQNRVQEAEEESNVLATYKKQTDLTAQAVFQENWELKEKIRDQEVKLNKNMDECEESKNQISEISRKNGEFLAHLSGVLDIDIRGKKEPQDLLISKLTETHKENKMLKGQISTLKEAISVHEMESKASRETIMRLVSEVSKEQKKAAAYSQDMDKLNKDLDSAKTAKESLELEISILQDKLAASQEAWEASKQELHHLKRCSNELDGSLKNSIQEARTAQSMLSAFKEQIAVLLHSSSVTVKSSEEAILERIRAMSHSVESKKTMMSQFEAQIAKLTEQLEIQTRSYQDALQGARKAEKQVESLQDQLRHLEGELVSGDVQRDGLKTEKQKYLTFLEQLSDKMKLDRIAAEIGFDMRLDAILVRAEQLVKLEGDAVIENKTMAHNLQRKLKTQKEKLESKELHMNLLRQKISQLEEEKQVRTALAVERDEANLTIRKLHKKAERLQKELDLARESNTDLKAKLSETSELKIKTLEQNRAIEELKKSQGKLGKMKEKAEKQLIAVKSELHLMEHEAKEDKERARNMLEATNSEVKALKTTLAEVTKREKQLTDFREVVSRMLGLSIANLALPDYEIITCLEGLIHLHQHHFVPCICLKDASVRQDGRSPNHLQFLH